MHPVAGPEMRACHCHPACPTFRPSQHRPALSIFDRVLVEVVTGDQGCCQSSCDHRIGCHLFARQGAETARLVALRRGFIVRRGAHRLTDREALRRFSSSSRNGRDDAAKGAEAPLTLVIGTAGAPRQNGSRAEPVSSMFWTGFWTRIVIDAWVQVSLVGIDLITVEARVFVARSIRIEMLERSTGAQCRDRRPNWTPRHRPRKTPARRLLRRWTNCAPNLLRHKRRTAATQAMTKTRNVAESAWPVRR